MMNDANENENETIALPFSSLSSSLLFVCLFGFGGLFFSVFFGLLSLSTLKSLACVLLFVGQWKEEKKRKEFFLPPNSLFFFVLLLLYFFFVRRDQTTRDGFDERTEEKYRKKRERKAEEGQTPKRQNEKTRASRRESVPFLGRKGESNVLSLRLFFESCRYVILLPRFYTLARVIEPLFAAQEEKAEEFLRAAWRKLINTTGWWW